jgi:hypothetical protein
MRRSSVPDAARSRAMVAGFALIGIGLLCGAQDACAFKVDVSEATYVNGMFHVTFEGVLDAPPAGVEAVLRDYTRYHKIDKRIRRAELVSRNADGTLLVRTLIDACAGFFCKTVERVERVEHGPGLLVSTVIPAQSDMREGAARTFWRAAGAGTHVRYVAEFQPDFWVPALIGRGIALRALRESTLQLFRNVEHEANAR